MRNTRRAAARRLAVVAGAIAAALVAGADEGMWTFDAFPADRVEATYGFRPTGAWLDQVRLSTLRLSDGCSGSFVSDRGLILTNHHCAEECVQALSSGGNDRFARGFHADTAAAEARCPDMFVDQLLAISDVTRRVREATAGREGEAYARALRAVIAATEKACQTSPELRCEVVTLYHGGVYALYTYRRHADIRLVFAPELSIAAFGGDPDNFMFPRYALDAAFFRAWADGAPADTKQHLSWAERAPPDGSLTFVAGNPGRTSRASTIAQLEYRRDVELPEALVRYAELRGLLTSFAQRDAEARRISTERLLNVENAYKALRGEWDALRDRAFFSQLAATEERLRGELSSAAAGGTSVASAFDAIARAQDRDRAIRTRYTTLERAAGFQGDLFHQARLLVRGAAEREKPDDARLREYRDAALPAVERSISSAAPIHPRLERLLLAHSLTKLREALGADDPAVRKALGQRSPEEVADGAVRGTRVGDPKFRRELWEGGATRLAETRDPMIDLARRVDEDARAVRAVREDTIDAVVQKSQEAIADARFAVQGRSTYPDATFTPRLSYGQVKGWTRADGVIVAPFTTFAGLFERATGRAPFELPASWSRARARLDPGTPFDFVTTNDIVGGNSGSPVLDRDLRVVGVAFDGNLESLGGDYGFDAEKNRAVAVTSVAILEALERVYGARRVADELRASVAPAAP